MKPSTLKKAFLLAVGLFGLSQQNASAQHLEFGLMGGAMYYEGDLSHTLGGTLVETHPSFGILAKYNMNDYIAIRGHFLYGEISGNDKHAAEDAFKARNFSFRSDIYELGAQAEFNILGYQPYALSKPFSPYVFAGIAGFKFNPKTLNDGEWVALQPLGTEGQGIPGRKAAYSTIGVAIPFGVGVKYALNDLWNIGLEVGFRKTFTDYLDDVSGDYISRAELAANNGALAAELGNKIDAQTGYRRGNPNNQDWYNFVGVTITYNLLDNGLVGARNRGRRRAGCKQARM